MELNVFVPTHYRKTDGLRAMLLSDSDGTTLYRVQFAQGRRTANRFITTASDRFAANYGARA